MIQILSAIQFKNGELLYRCNNVSDNRMHWIIMLQKFEDIQKQGNDHRVLYQP